MKRKIKSPGSAPGSWQPASPRSITLCSSGAPLSRFTSKVFFSCIRPSPPQAPHSSPALDKFHHKHMHTQVLPTSSQSHAHVHTHNSLSLSLCRSNRITLCQLSANTTSNLCTLGNHAIYTTLPHLPYTLHLFPRSRLLAPLHAASSICLLNQYMYTNRTNMHAHVYQQIPRLKA